MCGITGYRIVAGAVEAAARQLPGAVGTLQHRGPDDGDHWIEPQGACGIGQRRLAIIDLSAFGHQPMRSANGEWMMVFNGEIYNYQPVRAELEALGHRFEGHSDSSVILAAVTQWGMAALDRFIGMFAIALWHQPTRALHLIRDRLGVKPLYYHWDGKSLFFGSELKALRAFGGWTPEIDRDALVDYLRYG